jgi:hypothetical protein
MVLDSCYKQQQPAAADSGLNSREHDPRIAAEPEEAPQLAAFAAAFAHIAPAVLAAALDHRPAATVAETQALVSLVTQRPNPPRDAAVLVFGCWQRGEALREESAPQPPPDPGGDVWQVRPAWTAADVQRYAGWFTSGDEAAL